MLHRAGRRRAVERVRRAGIVAAVAIALAGHCGSGAARGRAVGGRGLRWGSSLLGGYGITTSVWRDGVEGWLGLGYLDGFRAGAFLRKGFGRDTLRLGNDALALRYPTDVFGNGYALLVQGASWSRTGARTTALAFGGASSAGLSAPSFLAAKAQAAMGALLVRHDLSPRVSLTGNAVVAARHTVVPGVEWRPAPGVSTALVGESARAGRTWPPARSSSAGGSACGPPTPGTPTASGAPRSPPRSRRRPTGRTCCSPGRWRPEFTIGVGRQNFVQDSADSQTPIRASGNSAFAGGRIGELSPERRGLRLALRRHPQPQLVRRRGSARHRMAGRRSVPAPEPAHRPAGHHHADRQPARAALGAGLADAAGHPAERQPARCSSAAASSPRSARSGGLPDRAPAVRAVRSVPQRHQPDRAAPTWPLFRPAWAPTCSRTAGWTTPPTPGRSCTSESSGCSPSGSAAAAASRATDPRTRGRRDGGPGGRRGGSIWAARPSSPTPAASSCSGLDGPRATPSR